MRSETEGKIINCRAAICWAANKPLTVETVTLDPPKVHEVRVKVIANSICHSDLHVYDGHTQDSEIRVEFPCILGHEMTGIVESVGEGVTEVVVGDHVASLFNSQCNECDLCKNPKTNICAKRYFGESRMADGTTRFHLNGKDVYYFVGIGSLSEYTVINEAQIVKINPKARMDRVCIFSCGFGTGYGSAVNVAKIEKGSSVGIWGLGAIGLAAVYGSRVAGAKIIVGIDTNDEKSEIAKKMGCTHFVNPFKCRLENKTVVDEVKRLTNGMGLDSAIECVGQIKTLEDALESVALWGTVVNVGVAPTGETLNISPNAFFSGKKLTGAMFGGYKGKEAIPKFVEEYVNGNFDVEDFFTGSIKLEAVDDAFQWLLKGKVLRTVVIF